MIKYHFNPFYKQIDQIEGRDLAVLKDISEGWYIDYKRDALTIKDIAKHLSAFANQFGGWLFFGVDEHPLDKRTAGSFPGINAADTANLLQRIREAAVTHVNPEVYYEEKIIRGPVTDIDLKEGQNIIIIGIPQGVNPPYIHSTGKIYRRTADKSDPKEETDRHILDNLWERGKNAREKLAAFLKEIPELSEADNSWTWAHIFFIADPFFNSFTTLKFEEFRDTMADPSGKLQTKAPMDNYFPTADGYIARQIGNNIPDRMQMTLRWYHGGNTRLTIPINVYDSSSFNMNYRPSEQKEFFLSLVNKQRFESIRIADFSRFLIAFAALLNQYIELLRKSNHHGPVFSRIILTNTWRLSPFIDEPEFIQQVERNGIPVIEDTNIVLPITPHLENLIPLEVRESEIPDMTESGEALGNQEVSDARRRFLPFFSSLPLTRAVLTAVGILISPDQILSFKSLWRSDNLSKK
jgi:hypothetical protein